LAFILRIYHNARFFECQIQIIILTVKNKLRKFALTHQAGLSRR